MTRLHNRMAAHTHFLSALIGVVLGLFLYASILSSEVPITSLILDWRIILGGFAFGAIGFIFGVVFFWQFLGKVALRIQGWPFHIGDEVEVISGKQAGRTALVYEVWESRSQVRLEMGKLAATSFEDVFCAINVTRK